MWKINFGNHAILKLIFYSFLAVFGSAVWGAGILAYKQWVVKLEQFVNLCKGLNGVGISH